MKKEKIYLINGQETIIVDGEAILLSDATDQQYNDRSAVVYDSNDGIPAEIERATILNPENDQKLINTWILSSDRDELERDIQSSSSSSHTDYNNTLADQLMEAQSDDDVQEWCDNDEVIRLFGAMTTSQARNLAATFA